MHSYPKQRGIALITVLVIASVLVIFASFILSARQINERRTFNIINTARASQYMVGAEEFGKTSLKKLFEQSKAERVVRTQAWATTPMTFPIEGNRGSLTGSIRDMHSCFNLNSILEEAKTAQNSERDERGGGRDDRGGSDRNTEIEGRFGKQTAGEKLFVKIIEPLMPEQSEASAKALAAALRDWVDDDQEQSGVDGAEDYHYTGFEIPYRTGDTLLADTSELLVMKGFTPEIYESIKDYICVLPVKEGTINVNTVDPDKAELVWALLDDIDLSSVQQALTDLPKEGYEQGDFFEALGGGKVSKEGRGRLVFDSKYLLMTAKAQIQTGRAEVKSLLLKNKNQFKVIARHIGD